MAIEQIDILETYLLDAVRHTLPQRSWSAVGQGFCIPSDQKMRESRLGFVSPQLKGMVALSVSEKILWETCPGIEEAGDQTSLYLDDWAGELSNLLLGRLKAKLLPHGIDLKLAPWAPSGKPEQSTDQNLPHWERTSILRHGGEYLQLVYRVQCDPTLDLSCQQQGDSLSLQPGEAVFRLAEAKDQKNRYDMVYKVRSGVAVEAEDHMEDIFAEEDRPPIKHYVPSGPSPLKAPSSHHKLVGLSWKDHGVLILSFEGQLSYEVCPARLLDQTAEVKLEVESLQIEVKREDGGIQISIPELQIVMRKQAYPTL